MSTTPAPQVGKSIVIKRVVQTLVTDGTITTWTLAKTPVDNANVDVFENGVMQAEGSDYTLVGTTITWLATDPPGPNDRITVKFWGVFNA